MNTLYKKFMGVIIIKGCHPKGFPAIFLMKIPQILMPFEASVQDSEDHFLSSLDEFSWWCFTCFPSILRLKGLNHTHSCLVY